MNETDSNVNDEAAADAAYNRVLPELKALSEEELREVNLDIPAAVITVMGVSKKVSELRPQIERELPTFDFRALEGLCARSELRQCEV
jgi:hypothetical protein